MKTIAELQKERMYIRKENPLKASVIGILIDRAKKIAKGEQREASENDIVAAAKRELKAMEKSVATIKEHGGETAEQEKEIEILKSFLPPQLSQEQIREEIEKILGTIAPAERIKKNQGRIMGQLKRFGDQVDMGVAAKIVSSLLK